MKHTHYILLTALLATACGQKTMQNGDAVMRIDRDMRVQFSSVHNGTAPFADGFVAADALEAAEFTANQFRLADAKEEKNGDVTTLILTGSCKIDGYEVEKHQLITSMPTQPDMLLFETYYVNTGNKTATVQAWQNHNLRMSVPANDTLLWSFQPSSTSGRADWTLPIVPGYQQRNYMGMNNCDYGGGIPMVDLWRRDGGLAVGLAEPVLRMVSMPVAWNRNANYATLAVRYDYEEPKEFAPGDTLRTYNTFVMTHTGDCFNALRRFSEYMQACQNIQMPAAEPEAFEPVWCAWGYERTFTIDEVLGTLPKAKELGFSWVDVDDGYQQAEGDWETNSRFRGGDKDMRRLTDAIHALGMKAKLWWAPLAADPDSKLLREHPEMQLMTKEYAPEYITWWNSFYLSPVNPATEQYTNDLVTRFMDTWNFDGLKIDGQHLNCCMPDYNEASRLDYPEQAVEQMPLYFKNVYEKARAIKSHAVVQVCPCGCAMNYFHLPYFNQAVASDPTSSWQIRLKRKAYAAMCPQTAYYADHVELSDGGCDFATQIGIGGVVGSKFTWPNDNPNVKESFLLTPEKEALVKKWVGIYQKYRLSQGEYLNLYDIGYDSPETHVVRKDGAMYYAFYAPQFEGTLELRGLDATKKYEACEYAADDLRTFEVDGAKPTIEANFTGAYLLQVMEK